MATGSPSESPGWCSTWRPPGRPRSAPGGCSASTARRVRQDDAGPGPGRGHRRAADPRRRPDGGLARSRLGGPPAGRGGRGAGRGPAGQLPALRLGARPLRPLRRRTARAWLVVEGVGSGSAAVAAYITVLVWVEVDDELRLARGLERDGAEMQEHWRTFMGDERALFARDRIRERADVLVDGTGGARRSAELQPGWPQAATSVGTMTAEPAARLGRDPFAQCRDVERRRVGETVCGDRRDEAADHAGEHRGPGGILRVEVGLQPEALRVGGAGRAQHSGPVWTRASAACRPRRTVLSTRGAARWPTAAAGRHGPPRVARVASGRPLGVGAEQVVVPSPPGPGGRTGRAARAGAPPGRRAQVVVPDSRYTSYLSPPARRTWPRRRPAPPRTGPPPTHRPRGPTTSAASNATSPVPVPVEALIPARSPPGRQAGWPARASRTAREPGETPRPGDRARIPLPGHPLPRSPGSRLASDAVSTTLSSYEPPSSRRCQDVALTGDSSSQSAVSEVATLRVSDVAVGRSSRGLVPHLSGFLPVR